MPEKYKHLSKLIEDWNGDIENMPSELAAYVEENKDNPFIKIALENHEKHKEQIARIKEKLTEVLVEDFIEKNPDHPLVKAVERLSKVGKEISKALKDSTDDKR